jgi:hypothetical protein
MVNGGENKMNEQLKAVLKIVPQQPQRQDGNMDQLRDLQAFANKLGMYDAADLLKHYIRARS